MRSPDDEILPLTVQPVALSSSLAACNLSPRRHDHGGNYTKPTGPDSIGDKAPRDAEQRGR